MEMLRALRELLAGSPLEVLVVLLIVAVIFLYRDFVRPARRKDGEDG